MNIFVLHTLNFSFLLYSLKIINLGKRIIENQTTIDITQTYSLPNHKAEMGTIRYGIKVNVLVTQ